MSKMILHCGAVASDYDGLKAVILPENHDKFKGGSGAYGTVPHARLIDSVRTMSKHLLGPGCIEKETFGLSGGSIYPGARMFAMLRFNFDPEQKVVANAPVVEAVELSDEQEIQRIAEMGDVEYVPREEGGDNPPRIIDANWNVMEDDHIYPAMVLRNSYDRSMAVSSALGYNCFICDNLAISGEITFSRRHTVNALTDVMLTLWGLFEVMKRQYQFDLEYRDAAKKFEIDTEKGYEILGRMAGAGILTLESGKQSQFALALSQWKNPAFEVFGPRTLWSLHNAVTYAQRKSGIGTRLEVGSNATAACREILGDQWSSKAAEIGRSYKVPAKATMCDLLDVINNLSDKVAVA
jgi:hypothetical protein